VAKGAKTDKRDKAEYAHVATPGENVRLADYDPSDTGGVSHDEGKELLTDLSARLTALQETHYAAAGNAILIILQGIDTAGKDGTVRHVLSSFNPTACNVTSFKVPTPEEAAHDFLWRAHRVTPGTGEIGIFNRSYYEDVLAARVHGLVPREVWERRYGHINNFESLLADRRTIVLKFFLHISKDEQAARLQAREKDKEKAWKLSPTDWSEHALYDEYVGAYEDALTRCSTDDAPWRIVPSDHKWFRDLAVARALVDTLSTHEKEWRAELDKRGQEALAAIAAAKKG